MWGDSPRENKIKPPAKKNKKQKRTAKTNKTTKKKKTTIHGQSFFLFLFFEKYYKKKRSSLLLYQIPLSLFIPSTPTQLSSKIKQHKALSKQKTFSNSPSTLPQPGHLTVAERISRNLIQSNAPFLSNPTSTKLSSTIKALSKHTKKHFQSPPPNLIQS